LNNFQSKIFPAKVNTDDKTNPSVIYRIFSIARNTFRKADRDRVLYNLVLFVFLITANARKILAADKHKYTQISSRSQII